MIQSIKISIDGMTCANCENRIERLLMKMPGVKRADVSYSKEGASIEYDDSIVSYTEIKARINQDGYKVKAKRASAKVQLLRIPGIVIMLLALYILLNEFGALNFLNAFPTAREGMGYGTLFMIGLLTSIHCVAMCGGINLSQCVSDNTNSNKESRFRTLKPTALYNLGRVLSYTAVGGIIGGIGSVFSFSGYAKGAVTIIAGVFMIIMALNMWNVVPWLRRLNPRMPKIFAGKINAQKNHNSPLYVGLLNGLMPCGPLQAMQLFALSAASPIKGALSMLLFSLGTVPLMFGLGAISTILKHKFKKKMMNVSAALVLLLGIGMLSNGFSLAGIMLPGIASQSDAAPVLLDHGVQVVKTKLLPNKYTPITVRQDIPVKWIITADKESLNGCNNEIVIPKYKIDKKLVPGDNIIEFIPEESGTVAFSCWMGMIKSQITVSN